MTKEIAEQIATLINRRNRLTKVYTSDMILSDKDKYVFIIDDKELVACAESKKLQWYQSEICHVSVNEKFRGQNKGREVLVLAENKAREENAKIIQCTIRSENKSSIRLFSESDYKIVNEFYNPKTENIVLVFQKNISEM